MQAWGRFVAILSMFFASAVLAQIAETVERTEVYTREGLQVVLVFQDDGFYKVAQFKIENSGAQRKVIEQAYSTRANAESRAGELRAKLEQKRVPRPAELFSFRGRMVGAGARGGGIYPTKAEWSEEWEQKYADWIRAEVTPDFFVRYNMVTDCADVAFSLRWIFARINGLRMGSTLSASRKILTNESTLRDWERLPTAAEWYNDRRFRTALNYLLGNVYTHSLQDDTYPVALQRPYFREGVIQLQIHNATGHTMVLNFVGRPGQSYDLPGTMVWSTTPPSVRQLAWGILYPTTAPVANENSFRQFRWPVLNGRDVKLVASDRMPGYSLEQFDPAYIQGHNDFASALMANLFPDFSPKKVLEGTLTELHQMIEARIQVVEEGHQFCKSNNCREGSQGYEDWSTPSRDKRLAETFKRARQMAVKMSAIDSLLIDLFHQSRQEKFEIDGVKISVVELELLWEAKLFNSDPNVTPSRRWNVRPEMLRDEIIEKTKKLLSDRDAKVRAKIASASEDADLLMLYAFANSRQFYGNTGLVPELEQTRFSIAGREESIFAWLGQAQGFDSRASSASRWGEATAPYKILEKETHRAIRKDGWAVVDVYPDGQIKNILTGELVSLPTNSSPVTLGPYRPLVLINNTGTAPALFDLSTRQTIKIDTSEIMSFGIKWFSPDTAAVFFASTMIFFELRSHADEEIFTPVYEIKGYGLASFFDPSNPASQKPKGAVLVNQHLIFFDTTSTPMKFYEIPLPTPASHSQFLSYEGEMGGRTILSSDNSEFYIVDLSQKNIQKVAKSSEIMPIGFPHGIAYRKMGLGHYDSQLSFVVDHEISGCPFFRDSENYVSFFCMTYWRFFFKDGDRWTERQLTPAGHTIWAVNRDLMVTVQNGKEHLWSLKLNRIIFSADKLRFYDNQKGRFIIAIDKETSAAPGLFQVSDQHDQLFYRGQALWLLKATIQGEDRHALLGPDLDDIYTSAWFTNNPSPLTQWSKFVTYDGAVVTFGNISLWMPL